MQTIWTEATVGAAVIAVLFRRKYLAVPNCGWTGHEADLLIVDKTLRLIDVEVKISRSDLKQDLTKDKWYSTRPWRRCTVKTTAVRREWPDKVWKHYYALPADIWQSSLLTSLPAASGILLLSASTQGNTQVKVIRHAKPNRDAKPVSAADAVDIARLISLRYWAIKSKLA